MDRKQTVGPEELQRRIRSLERREFQLQIGVLFVVLVVVVAGLVAVTLPGSTWQLGTLINARRLRYIVLIFTAISVVFVLSLHNQRRALSSAREALARFFRELAGTQTTPVERLIAVMGTKGGVGTSTVAVNLGVQLTRLTQKRVVLLDFARPLGYVSLLLDLQPRFSVRDAAENVSRLDSYFFADLRTHHQSGLEVLAGASHPDEWQTIPLTTVARLVEVAQSSCDFVLMDLGSVYSSEWSPILSRADKVLLVAEANVPALWTLGRHISTLVSCGVDRNRISVIINRWHRRDEDAVKAVEKNVKLPVFARLPADSRQVSEATNLGVPLSKNHGDALGARFRHMACRLAGIAPVSEENSGLLTRLFSL